ncbi:ribonuclease Z [Parendozoicomonas haliclonae]|uniref:Ribonuclease Z n=1 Tax=Parendozoicomonas haliclonae TaxID=1960125 RepID=A0A1X7AP59_9GAMM|nr:ribonuclease Z [Parendozoicomonas haliclonae]SMA50076.1 Ribonuclease Z [Parendozoicomonas haliclonae]
MRLTFLGTAAGLPSKHRNVSATILARDDSKEWCLVDCGEGTQHQLLYSRYSLHNLQGIFITHVHGDHMFGLPGLLTSASMQGRTAPLTICAPEGVESFVRNALQCAAVTHLPYELHFVASDNESFQFLTSDFEVSAHELSHRVPCYAYAFKEHPLPGELSLAKLHTLNVPRGPLWGQLHQGQSITLTDGTVIHAKDVHKDSAEPRVVIIAGDNDRPAILHDIMTRADLLVHEATFSTPVREKVGDKWMHSTPRQVGEAAEAAGLKHVILSHFSNRYPTHPKPNQTGISDLRKEAQDVYSGTVTMAKDHGCWELRRDRKLVEIENS